MNLPRIFEPQLSGWPRTAMTSLMPMGTPSSGFCVGAAGDGLVGGVGLGQGVGGIVTDEGMDPAIDALDLVQAGLHGLARGNLAAAEFGGQFRNGQLVQHGAAVHSTIFGTMKSPLAWAGALRRASSCGQRRADLVGDEKR